MPTGTRDSGLELLLGSDGWVTHHENGISYSLDATKCMFSWGNRSEKLRMAALDCTNEVIVDLFAGIGYFVLPFLIKYVLLPFPIIFLLHRSNSIIARATVITWMPLRSINLNFFPIKSSKLRNMAMNLPQ
jgi:Met-10+ like-protein